MLDRAERASPNDPGVLLTRAVLLGRMRELRRGAVALHRRHRRETQGRLGPNELLEKGRLLDQIGRYDEAFAAFAEGKRPGRELSAAMPISASEARRQLDRRLRSFFTARGCA